MKKKKTDQRFKIGDKAITSMPVTVKAIDKENYILTMVASTQDVDRHGDTIMQSGWSLERYLENPVILNSHNYRDATEVIAKAIRTEIKGKGKKARLEQDWQFAVNENPKAKIIFDLYAEGYLHASSVGFIPTKFATDAQGNEDWWTIEEAELLEVSAVSVPANAYALAKQKGLALDDENGDPLVDVDDEDEIEDEEDDDVEEDDYNDEKNVKVNCTKCEKEIGVVAIELKDFLTGTICESCKDAEIDEEEPAPTPAPAARPTYRSLAAKAIHNIQAEEKRQLIRAHGIIQSLLNGEDASTTKDHRLQKQLRNRKVNQAIRSLIKAK